MKNTKTKIKKTTIRLALIVAGMFVFAFAMIPFYNSFCKITGLNGKIDLIESQKLAAKVNVQKIRENHDRQILVELDSTVNKNLPIHFVPKERMLKVYPGQVSKTYFKATNHSDRTLIFQAIPSISPGLAARHFQKLECFCFQRQVLKPQETAEFPLQFVLSDQLPNSVQQLTLSYTIYEMQS